ncbi:cellulose biosynthesis protein BcsQ [Bacillus fengqiuensis]|nr:cellulose biosynthesis protein BcsQ [Bacillus fengqiuensis]
MESYIKKSLEEWKEEISELLGAIDEEYEKVKQELKLYTYKYGITKQVIQSTVNDEIIENIRELYHKPFEERYNELKEDIKDLEEKRKVFQMFVNKIDEVSRKEDAKQPYIPNVLQTT